MRDMLLSTAIEQRALKSVPIKETNAGQYRSDVWSLLALRYAPEAVS